MSGRPSGGRKEMGEGRYQVEVVAHQAPRVNLPVGFSASLGQGVQQQEPVFVVMEDRFTAVSPVHGMVNRSRVLHPELSRHCRRTVWTASPDCQGVLWKNFVLAPLRALGDRPGPDS